MADDARAMANQPPQGAASASDLTRRAVLGRLRGALERKDLRFPPPNPPALTAQQRMAVTAAHGGAAELAARFITEAELLHATAVFVGSPAEARLALINRLIDWRNEDEASARGMRIQTGQERMVLGWQNDALPLEYVAESLADMGMHLVTPATLTTKQSREEVRHIRYGITGAEAAFAATGSLLLAATPQTLRAAGLLPLRHIALVPIARLFANVEAWLAEMRRHDMAGWLRSKPNVTLITGPSKSADIEMILTLGVHGPKFLHVILFDDGVPDDEQSDSFWRYVPGGPGAPEPDDAMRDFARDDGLLPYSLRNVGETGAPDAMATRAVAEPIDDADEDVSPSSID